MWRLVLVVFACSGLPREPETLGTTKGGKSLATAARDRDANEIEAMFANELVFGGMWFPDEECRRQFPDAGRVVPEARARLARCMAMLPLELSDRSHTYPEIAVLTYVPGLEIEVQFDPQENIRWIGFVSRSSRDDALPTITQRALDSLRTTPTLLDEPARMKLDAIVARARAENPRIDTAFAYLKVCIDPTGKVVEATPRASSSLEASDIFVAAAKQWTFRPFDLGGQPAAVCSLVAATYPKPIPIAIPALPLPLPATHADAKSIPGVVRRPLVGERLITPEDADKVLIQRSKVRRLIAVFQVCTNEDGVVDHVAIARSSGIARYDTKIVAALRRWRYPPLEYEGRRVKSCTQQTFIYSQS